MKTTISIILISTFLILVGCSSQDSSQTEPKPPDINLHVAAIQGNLEAVKQHIKAGSDLDEKEPSRGSTPLLTAAVFGKTEIVKALIEAGADINYQNNEGSTALHSAAFFCRTEIVKILLEKGADKTLKNSAGRTPLESVTSPFESVKDVYDQLRSSLGPLGLELDYEQIKETRPMIAEMLQ